jgi:hypothetical protein
MLFHGLNVAGGLLKESAPFNRQFYTTTKEMPSGCGKEMMGQNSVVEACQQQPKEAITAPFGWPSRGG